MTNHLSRHTRRLYNTAGLSSPHQLVMANVSRPTGVATTGRLFLCAVVANQLPALCLTPSRRVRVQDDGWTRDLHSRPVDELRGLSTFRKSPLVRGGNRRSAVRRRMRHVSNRSARLLALRGLRIGSHGSSR